MKNLVFLLLLLLLLLLTLAGSLGAETYVVSPGHNGMATITTIAKPGDHLTVNFVAAANYELVSAECGDPGKLGWQRTGPFSFALTVPATVSSSFQVANCGL